MFSDEFSSWGKLDYRGVVKEFNVRAKEGLGRFKMLYPKDYMGKVYDDFIDRRVVMCGAEWRDNSLLSSRENYLKAHEECIAAEVGKMVIGVEDASLSVEEKARVFDAIVRYSRKLEDMYEPTGKFFLG